MPITVYDGVPGNGEIIGRFDYCKQSRWLEFQPETYTLTKVLRGVHTISVETVCKADLGGLVFSRRQKETAEILAVENENIYGDKFTREKEAVTGIGNNVILDFGKFDFTAHSPAKLVITGKSKLPKNSIQVMFEGDGGARIICDFEKAETYTPREFPLDVIRGIVKVSFIFLPGCDFDFLSFRFE